MSTHCSCQHPCIASSAFRSPMGDSPPPMRSTRWGICPAQPADPAQRPSCPRRQRLSRWKVCLTTGPSLLCHPSLTGGVARRRVRPRPVYSRRQPMQALYYRGRHARLPAGTGNLLRWFVYDLAVLNTYAVLDLYGVIREVQLARRSSLRGVLAATLYG